MGLLAALPLRLRQPSPSAWLLFFYLRGVEGGEAGEKEILQDGGDRQTEIGAEPEDDYRSDRRGTENTYRRITQQDALLDGFQQLLREQQATMLSEVQRQLREMNRESFREVRERPEEEHEWGDRQRTRTRATDRSEVSGTYLNPGSREPASSTPLRQVAFDLEDGQSPADQSAGRTLVTSVEHPGGLGLGEHPGGRWEATAPVGSTEAAIGRRMAAYATIGPAGAAESGRMDAPAPVGPTRVVQPRVPHLGDAQSRTDLSAQPVAIPGRVPPGASGNVTLSDIGGQSMGGGGGGPRGPLVRIGEYDGESDLTAFLGRFERMAQLYRWSEEEQIIFLETSLKGAAADIVYEMEPTTTINDMKDMLRLRFGTERQGEVTRTELQHTRRQQGEPLQKLYRTIKKLMSVGYPGPATAMRNWIGRDHFLRALNDDLLSVQVSIQKPQTLEEALTTALELEALGVGREGERLRRESQAGSSQRDRMRPPRTSQVGFAYEATNAPETSQPRDVEALVRMVGSWMDRQDTKQSRTSSETDKDPTPTWSDSRGTRGGGWRGRGRRPATGGNRPRYADKSSRVDDICIGCRKRGHWVKDCPNEKAKRESTAPTGAAKYVPSAKGAEDSDPEVKRDGSTVKRARVVTVVAPELRKLGGAVYLRVRVDGKLVYALLDTGCEHSLVGSRCLPSNVPLGKTDAKLVAANGTKIPLLGKVKLQVTTDGFSSDVTFLVSENVSEMILGIDWLNQEDCEWSFHRKSLIARGHVCKLFVRNSSTSRVRRIYAQEQVIIPARHFATVPTRIVWMTVGEKEGTFIVEPKELDTGVMITRTMIGAEALTSALPVVNLSGKLKVVTSVRLPVLASEAVSQDPGDTSRLDPELLATPDQSPLADRVLVLRSEGASSDPDLGRGEGDTSRWAPELLVTPGPSTLVGGVSLLKPPGAGGDPSLCRAVDEDELEGGHVACTAVSAGDTNISVPLSAEVIQQEQKADRALSKVIELIQEAPENRDWNRAAGQSREVQDLWAQAGSLTLVGEILYRRYVRPDGTIQYRQLVVPETLRAEVLRHVHGGTALGHFGVNKTASMLQKYGYWAGWRKDVEQTVRTCEVCNRYRHGPPSKQGELQPQPSNFPMQKFHIDLTGPHVRSKNGFVYLFTGICNFTKYLIAVPIRDKTAITVARVLVKYVYLQYGAVDILVSDNGGEFANEISHQLNHVLGIQGIRITAYRASSNGVCERVHRSIHSVFAKTIAANQRNWCEMVPYVAYAYNIATHSSTTYSPFYLMFGREAKTNLNNLLEIPDDEREATPESYAKEVTHNMAQAYDIVCKELNCKFERAKQRYDARVKPVQFKVGQFVWFYCPRKRPGLNPKWTNRNTGPHLIMRRHNLVNYTIKFTPRGNRVQIVHVDKLTPYLGEVSGEWKRQQQLLTPCGRGEATDIPDVDPTTPEVSTEDNDKVVRAEPETVVLAENAKVTPPKLTAGGDTAVSGKRDPVVLAQGEENRPQAKTGTFPQATTDPQAKKGTFEPEAADAPANEKRVQPARPKVKPARFRLVASEGPPSRERVLSLSKQNNKVERSESNKEKRNFGKSFQNKFNSTIDDATAENQVCATNTNYTPDYLLQACAGEAEDSLKASDKHSTSPTKTPRISTKRNGELKLINTESEILSELESDANYYSAESLSLSAATLEWNPRPYESASEIDDLLELGEDIFTGYIGFERDEDSLEELFQPDMDRLNWDFSPLEEPEAPASPWFPASGASVAPEVRWPMCDACVASPLVVDAEVQASRHSALRTSASVG